ncbi:MAG: carbonic anhydrase [Deferribacterales bacterium]|nr:carbonic anhydrase [Deferribacterales bacterium]
MEKLIQGLVKFKSEDFETYSDVFSDLKDKQNPHTLFIGCSDSRVVPTLITNAMPGELFLLRNIANIVPPYREDDQYFGTQAVIEYAVNMLNVENIVVCGHSNCGGCNSLLNYYNQDFSSIKSVKKWLSLGLPALERLNEIAKEKSLPVKEWMIEQLNIIEQIKNLLTYPYIAEKYKNKKINIYGWYYLIEKGVIFNYNKETNFFEPINL